MVRFEVVDLFSEDDSPEVFTAGFYDVEGLDHAGAVTRESRGWSRVLVTLI